MRLEVRLDKRGNYLLCSDDGVALPNQRSVVISQAGGDIPSVSVDFLVDQRDVKLTTKEVWPDRHTHSRARYPLDIAIERSVLQDLGNRIQAARARMQGRMS